MQPLGASSGLVNCVPDQGASKPTGATQPQDKGPAKATMSKGEAERATSVGRGERIKEVLDFDWKLLYTLSSDKVEGVAKPSVRLQLVLDAGAGKRENLLYEMNDQELDELLGSLQKILEDGRAR
ncbi:COMM domain-containing protein [Chloropicon roscoffensis]|uniref:COMM domain-containing protein n=1 Tax=Chloropicon roscoffensis TaxID=1461544 RepID=A0AAX4P5D7_9CHLO